jgi:uncharacterized protein (TIGR03435 family)
MAIRPEAGNDHGFTQSKIEKAVEVAGIVGCKYSGNNRRWRLLLAVAGSLAVALACPGQTAALPGSPDAAAKVPQFEVISVKPDKSGRGSGMARFHADGLSVVNMSVHDMLTAAFHVFDDQVLNEPAWVKTEPWDIDAKVGGDDVAALQSLSFDQRTTMFQQIVTERFGLKTHHETRELPVYALVVAKGGVKMTAAKPFPNPPAVAKNGPGSLMLTGRGKLEAEGTTMPYVATVLENQVQRKVVDRTGLTGAYDFTLTWTPDQPGNVEAGGVALPAGDESAPSIFTAVQEQLGLKLEASKGPVDVIVVDQIEKPEAN